MLKRKSPEETGKTLLELRDGRTRTYVAARTGISVSALQSYEEGRRNPPDRVKARLASYYGRSEVDIFYTGENCEKQ